MQKRKVIIVGSGIAGLHAALKLADKFSVTLVTKAELTNSNSRWAQGGIAAVTDGIDSFEEHVEDTLKAGVYHNNVEAVKLMVERGPAVLDELIKMGVEFARGNDGELSLTREGGHGKRRIAYKGDITGLEIEEKLAQELRQNGNVEIIEGAFAVDLLVSKNECKGVLFWHNNTLHESLADEVILATGGLGRIYRYTTNPAIATGDGFAMAYRAGALVLDMEFVQFHPTVFVAPDGSNLLLSEALRGEGAMIVDEDGARFIDELAPRDVVARAIFLKNKTGQSFLKMANLPEELISERFPYIYQSLQGFGYNLAKDLIPVQPAAHFSCGGVKTDLSGRTSIRGLYAFGEVACTGVHGANRLASNSLLEAMAMSVEIAELLLSDDANNLEETSSPFENANDWDSAIKILQSIDQENFLTLISKTVKDTQELMQENAGVERSIDSLKTTFAELMSIEESLIGACRGDFTVDSSNNDKNDIRLFWEALNIVQTSLLIVEAAMQRPNSLGCHQVN